MIARRPHADQAPHDEPEIEATGVDEHTLQDVGVTAQVRSTHPARVVHVRDAPFEKLAAPA